MFPFSYGYVPTAAEWNNLFLQKQDKLPYTPLNSAGGTMQGQLFVAPSTINRAGLVISPGVSPATPSDGSIWTAGATLNVQLSGKKKTLLPADGDGSGLLNIGDSAIATPATPSAGIDSAKIRFLASGSSVLARPALNKLRESVSILDFACADGSAVDLSSTTQDHTAALTNATAAAYEVRVPQGGRLNLRNGNIPPARTLCGPRGPFSIQALDGTSDVLTVQSGSVISKAVFNSQDGVAARTGGAYLIFPPNTSRQLLEDVDMHKGYRGLVTSASTVVARSLFFFEMDNAVACVDILAGLAVYFDNPQAYHNPAKRPLANFRIYSCGDVDISRANICNATHQVLLVPGSGQEIDSLKIRGSYLDTGVNGLTAQPGSGGVIARSRMEHSWTSGHTNNGTTLDAATGGGTINGFAIIGHEALGNTGDGIALKGTSGVIVEGGQLAGNGGSGFSASNGASGFKIAGKAIIGPYGGFGPNGYPIYLDGTCTGYTIDRPVDMRGNTNAPVIAGSADRIDNPLGYRTEATGALNATPDSSGLVTITHGLVRAPSMWSGTSYAQPVVILAFGSPTATTMQLKVLNLDGSARTTALNLYWRAQV